MKVAAVIVTYNRKNMLEQCINHILRQSYKNVDIIVIDNNSNDGTGDFVCSIDCSNLFYFNTGENLGGAGGFAYGLNEAYKLGYDYSWIMDDDTLPKENSLESLVDKINKIDAAYICSRAVWIDGKACLMNTPRQGTTAFLYNIEATNEHLIQIPFCSFVSCLINMKYAEKVGLPISEFFIYGDDVEYTKRLGSVANGYIDLDSVVEHAMPVNNWSSVVVCDSSRIDRCKYEVRNNMYISLKRDHKSLLNIIFEFIKIFGGIVINSKDNKLRRISTLVKGSIDGLCFNPKIKMFQK